MKDYKGWDLSTFPKEFEEDVQKFIQIGLPTSLQTNKHIIFKNESIPHLWHKESARITKQINENTYTYIDLYIYDITVYRKWIGLHRVI